LKLLTLGWCLALSSGRDVEEVLELFTLGYSIAKISARIHISMIYMNFYGGHDGLIPSCATGAARATEESANRASVAFILR
jgi:hypothetical protein